MISLQRLKHTILLTAAALLCTSPAAAASKSKSGATRVKARTTTSSSHAKAASASRSSRTSSHPSAKSSKTSQDVSENTARVATGRRGRKSRVQSVAVSKPKYRGQQSIDQARTIEIQQALIRERYLSGDPTGAWDQATRDALVRFQNDNHWQTKIVPDSRALIKLGLGPSQERLLNPESAAIAAPYQGGLEKAVLGGGSN